MTRVAALALLMFCLASGCAAESAAGQPQPIPAAEAESRVAETRDVLTDLLWMGTEPYWHAGEWEECLRLCRQVVEVDPHFVEAYTSVAWLLWSHGRDAEAVEAYQGCVEDNPESWKARHEFGMYYFSRRKYDQAAEQLRHAVNLGAPTPHVHMLPIALEKAGRRQQALEEWRVLLKRFPDDVVAKRHAERLEKELKQGGKGKT